MNTLPPGDATRMIDRVLDWSGGPAPDTVMPRLATFHDWLRDEAIPAGGLGPNEGPRLWQRHIADSLTYLVCLPSVATVLDVGSGVGLPGIPLAIALPTVEFTLLDRAGGRCQLARRAVRLLDLDNVEVVCAAVADYSSRFDAIVSRATIAPDRMLHATGHLIGPGGVIITAGSHVAAPPDVEAPWQLIAVPKEVIGGEGSWLLKATLDHANSGYAPRHDRSG